MLKILQIYFFEGVFGLFMIYLLLIASRKFPRLERGSNNVRLPFFDFFKGVLIIGVILMHASDLIPETKFFKIILWPAVYLFIFISGYLLAFRNRNKMNLREYLVKIFFRIFLVYLVFVLFSRLSLGRIPSIGEVLSDIVFGGIYGSYYFIPIIMQFYLIFPLINKFRDKLPNLLVITSIFLFSLFFQILNNSIQKPYWNSNPISVVFFGRFLFFFCLGMLFSDFDLSKIDIKKIYIIFLAFSIGPMIFFIYTNEIYSTYFYPVIIFLLAVIFHNFFEKKYNHTLIYNITKDIGKNSLIIYLSHGAILYGLMWLYRQKSQLSIEFNNLWIFEYISLVLFTVSMSFLVSKLFMSIYLRVINPIKNKEHNFLVKPST